MISANRTMYDSTDLSLIPQTGAELIGYYLNGRFAANTDELEARFPADRYTHVPIDVTGAMAHKARVFDVETGDIFPGNTQRCIEAFNQDNPEYHNGARPVLYCNRSTIKAVRVGTGPYKLGRDYYLLVATLDGSHFTGDSFTSDAPQGVIGCQVATLGSASVGAYYDYSVIYSAQWMQRT